MCNGSTKTATTEGLIRGFVNDGLLNGSTLNLPDISRSFAVKGDELVLTSGCGDIVVGKITERSSCSGRAIEFQVTGGNWSPDTEYAVDKIATAVANL